MTVDEALREVTEVYAAWQRGTTMDDYDVEPEAIRVLRETLGCM